MNASLPATARDPSALQAGLTAALSQIMSDNVLLQGHEGTISYECNGLAAYRQVPLAVVLLDTEAQIVEILRACHRMDVPVMPHDAGTSLPSGAMPTPGGLALSLAKFRRIIKVDPCTRTAVVQPGVRNLAISEVVNSHGLYYTPDPSSQIAYTIGGNVNKNFGGVHCLKYDLTVRNVLRVCAAMVDGEVVEFGSEAPDAPGFDLLATVIGSRGMLAAVTEVAVRLIPKPQLVQVIMASFNDVESSGNTMADAVATDIAPVGLKMMGKPATATMEEFVCAGYNLDAAVTLLCESDGTPKEVAEEIAHMSEVLRASGATRIQVSQSEAERLRFWNDRKNAFPAADRISPDYYCMDGTISCKHIDILLRHIQQMGQKYTLRYTNVFYAGDGSMHPLILFNDEDQDKWHRAELLDPDILETCVGPGGTITGEHGVGVEKLSSMCMQLSAEEHDTFPHIKTTFDPVRLLNPDKAIPTLARCAEYGKLHVRNSPLPHPDLPRF